MPSRKEKPEEVVVSVDDLNIITDPSHPALTGLCKRVEPERHKTLSPIVTRMLGLMQEAGGVGLAAPQVGLSYSFFVVSPEVFPAHPVFVNPRLVPLSDDRTVGVEGCLSLPGVYKKVPRYDEVRIIAYDLDGYEIALPCVRGLPARVLQHEFDHLRGILITSYSYDEVTDR